MHLRITFFQNHILQSFCRCCRYVSGNFAGPYLAGYDATPGTPHLDYGLQRLDHAVGNVHKLLEAVDYIMGFTGAVFFGLFFDTSSTGQFSSLRCLML